VAVALGLTASPEKARADPPPLAENDASGQPPAATLDPTFMTGLFSSSRATLLGDLFGVRTAIARYGLTLGVTETSEVFGNATGGIRRGADYEGLTTATLQLDTLKAFGLAGGLVNVSAFQIHGRPLEGNLLALQTVSGIAANRSTRLWEAWYQQTFLDGKFDIKVGQQSADQEFIASANSALFENTMMGWPLLPSYDQYAGGPAYPLSSLAVRLRGQITPTVTGLLGVFDDNPPGGPFTDDSQTRGIEAAGLRFNLNTGALVFGELQYALNQPSAGDVDVKENKGLPGTYKIGFWADTARFPNQSIDNTGTSLANPASSGTAANERGNFSFYGVFDQMIWRPEYTEARAISLFARAMGAPGDRNLIQFSLNGGLTLKAPFDGRDGDSVGVGVGYGQVSSGARALDLAAAGFATTGTYSPVRTSETFIEATYQYQVAPWWQIQPDFQYIFNPGGGIVNPLDLNTKVQNEAVFGLRTNITF
jgi:porin